MTTYLKHIVPFVIASILLAACGIYSFRDISIPPEAKTVRLRLIENRARYVNPQLAPQLTDRLRQKINNQTRLTLVQTEDAHFDINAYVSDYTVTTAGISNQQAATNRLTVTVTITFQNRVQPEKSFEEQQISRNFDFSASLSLNQAEAQLGETIVRNMTDEIFNRIFSDW
ncbi:MAG TPA: LPS assembly lipoprotein LptE [Chitinophagaceae bacterium]|nr:LPS assembly lipoprotein LptE [Chitinophagaceae bacterium]